MTGRRENLWAALCGVVAAVATLAAAEVAAALLAPASSPVLAVGAWIIDVVPGWFKTVVIDLFGTGDKVVLLVCLGALVLALALVAGIAEYRRPPAGVVVLFAVGVVALLAVTSRAGATAAWALPTVAGVVVGVVALRILTGRLRRWLRSAAAEASGAVEPASLSRRGFFVVTGATAAAAVLAGVTARVANAGTAAVMAVRAAITLPRPATPAPAVQAGAQLEIDGITPLVTPNDAFYRIDTALQVPLIDASTWTLRVTGMVENDIEIDFEQLLALPLVETHVTLLCVSNEVGGELVGNAKWLGYPIRDLLARARPLAGADMVLSRSADGFTAGTPLEVLQDPRRDSLLAVGMNGEQLPLEHGYPVRMVVPGLFGYVSATKWLVELEVTRFDEASAYWTDRGWSARGPVKTSSRIDVPRFDAAVASGRVTVAGVAWAPHTGIERVEVRVDAGEWREATLAAAISADTWRQWYYEWDATAGDHELEVRATDAAGETQRGRQVPVVPNGAEGWHTVNVRVD